MEWSTEGLNPKSHIYGTLHCRGSNYQHCNKPSHLFASHALSEFSVNYAYKALKTTPIQVLTSIFIEIKLTNIPMAHNS